MKLQYLLGLGKFKATGQSLGNLKPALQVRHYLTYTVCPIADRNLVFGMKLYLVRQTSAQAHKRSGHLFLGKRTPLSAPSEARWTNQDWNLSREILWCFNSNNKNEQISLRIWESNIHVIFILLAIVLLQLVCHDVVYLHFSWPSWLLGLQLAN